ncbi:MAG TPA: MFS transporter [Terriglobales bacterium]|nr:MFS transporter [Terriglobales bacterium]
MSTSTDPSRQRRAAAMRFILCLGLVSLFADMTYEGARAIVGPYLQVLGASGWELGLVVGLGEMCAASLRYFTGKLADRSRAYWTLAISGYVVNLLVVPALAFVGSWQVAALLVIAERTGKALRGPARDVLLSEATAEVGHGWGFGIHTAMDQTGAVLGPLWVALAVAREHGFRQAFLPLAIPAIAALTALLVARSVAWNRTPPRTPEAAPTQVLPRVFWLYVAAAGLLAFGYLDFPFFAYYWVKQSLFADPAIPLLYAAAMGIEGLCGLVLGRLYDRCGLFMLSAATVVSLFALPLGFFGGRRAALAAIVCWAVGTGAQSASLRSGIATVVSMNKRGTAFGAFNGVWGVSWFAGSALMGLLLDHSRLALVILGVGAQAASAIVFLWLRPRLAAARHGSWITTVREAQPEDPHA